MKKLPPLKLCILMDLIGCSSYIIPFFGEMIDTAWAPVSAVIFYFMFGRSLGTRGALFSFVEEWLPFTDIIPTFTIAWFMRKANISKTQLAGKLSFFKPRQKQMSDPV